MDREQEAKVVPRRWPGLHWSKTIPRRCRVAHRAKPAPVVSDAHLRNAVAESESFLARWRQPTAQRVG
jgi:hypothetical protein